MVPAKPSPVEPKPEVAVDIAEVKESFFTSSSFLLESTLDIKSLYSSIFVPMLSLSIL